MFGGTAAHLRTEWNLPVKCNVRDHLSTGKFNMIIQMEGRSRSNSTLCAIGTFLFKHWTEGGGAGFCFDDRSARPTAMPRTMARPKQHSLAGEEGKARRLVCGSFQDAERDPKCVQAETDSLRIPVPR